MRRITPVAVEAAAKLKRPQMPHRNRITPNTREPRMATPSLLKAFLEFTTVVVDAC